MTRYIFTNVIAAGPVNWKASLTAEGQPKIREAFAIDAETDDAGEGDLVTHHEWDLTSSADLNAYAEAVASGAIVVGHSVDYHHGHLRARMLEIGTDPCDGRAKTICTMLGLTGIVTKFNGRRGWPTFDEVCHHYGYTRSGNESAEDNARTLAKVFWVMIKTGVVPDAKIWRERDFPK